jgi:hypothetical protein
MLVSAISDLPPEASGAVFICLQLTDDSRPMA